MTVRINKDAINLREKLSQLDKPSGLVGEELLRADTSADAREALNLEEHLFEDFESTGIDDNATSTKVTVSDSGVDVDGTVTADGLAITASTTSASLSSNDLIFTRDTYDAYIRQRGTNGSITITTADGVGEKNRVSIKGNGDVAFYEDTGTTAKFFWDASAERLNVGGNINYGYAINVGDSGFGINSTSTAQLVMRGTEYRFQGVNASPMTFYTSNTERMRIDSSGNVGIGTDSPSEKLDVRGAVNGTHAIFTGQAGRGLVIGTQNTLNNDDGVSYDAQTSSGKHLFKTNGAERARIDSSGNLLVGGTSAYASDATTLQGNGWVYSRRTSDKIMTLRRDGTDGDMLTFDKNGSTVGSIGTSGGQLNIGLNTTSGLNFGSSIIYPRGTGNTTQNGTIDLGNSGNRFKDLYLSGGVITSSDYRLKDDIQPMQSYADTVKQMNLVNFAWKESGEREDGFIAHELQALVPSAVRGEKDAVGEDGNEQYQGVDPLKLIPVLTKALQEALERIETLENK